MRRLSALVAVAMTMIAMSLNASPAHAEPVPYEESVLAAPDGDTHQSSGYVTFYVKLFKLGVSPTQDIRVILRTYDCHGRQTGTSESLNPDWGYDDFGNVVWLYVKDHALGPLRWTVDVTQPGYDPYQLSGDYNPKLPCPPLVDDSAPIVITKWSRKKPGFKNAAVGQKLAITATRATTGSSVSYDWYAGKRRVWYGRTLRVKNSMVGKPIKMMVTVYKGDQTKRRIIHFGRARN